jgi:hypothetical protein
MLEDYAAAAPDSLGFPILYPKSNRPACANLLAKSRTFGDANEPWPDIARS